MAETDWCDMSYLREFPSFPFWRYNRSKETVSDMLNCFAYMGGFTRCTLDEYIALYEMGRGYHNNKDVNGYILEYGTNRGASISMMAQGLKDCSNPKYRPAFTVDPFRADSTDSGKRRHEDSRKVFIYFDLLHKWVCPIISLSHEVQEWWNLPVRVLFIDASHIYEDIKSDLFDSIHFIVDEGWIICHDYKPLHAENVVRAVNEFLDSPYAEGVEVYSGPDSLISMRIRKHER